MASKWLEIFKTGTHTSGNGITKTYTSDDLKVIAETYNGQKDHIAPFVIGHPETDSPAYGWAKELKLAGEKLLAFVDQVPDGVVDAVKNGHYKKISIAIYPNGLLRHIGLLGATPPAVKGLEPVAFSADKEFEEYAWATDEYRMPTVGRILSGIRDFFIEKFGLDTADKIIGKDDVAHLQASAESIFIPDTAKLEPVFTENQNEEEKIMDELKAKVKTLEEAITKRDKEFAELQSSVQAMTAENKKVLDQISSQLNDNTARTKQSAFEAAKASFGTFCEDLVKEGKILPAEKDSVIEEYAELLKMEETLTFAEGAKKPSERMKERLSARPVIFAQRGTTFADPARVKKIDIGKVPVEFAALADKVDPTSVELDKEIREYAEKNNVSYEVAAAAVTSA